MLNVGCELRGDAMSRWNILSNSYFKCIVYSCQMLEVLFEYFAPFTIGKYNSEFRNTENMVLWSNETILYVYYICFLGYVHVHQK